MQEKYSPITQSRFENICSSHIILTQGFFVFFLTLLSCVSAEDINLTVILFRAACPSRFCANIQCISIQ